jgi:hypothetical protein
MSRHPSPLVARRHDALVQRLRELKAEHPFWGYRRIWPYWRFIEQRPVHKKRVLHLLREQQLLVRPHSQLQAKGTPMRSKPKPTQPNEWWGIDMTTELVEGFGCVCLSSWCSIGSPKTIVGSQVDLRSTAQHWLAALDMAVNRQLPEGDRGAGLNLRSDHGCQPTSVAFMRACSALGIQQAFTSDHNPKGHADTERMIRTLKEECLWRHKWTSPVT